MGYLVEIPEVFDTQEKHDEVWNFLNCGRLVSNWSITFFSPSCSKYQYFHHFLFQVKAFFDSKESNIGTGKKTVEETLAKIKSNIKWKEEHFDNVKQWFTDVTIDSD